MARTSPAKPRKSSNGNGTAKTTAIAAKRAAPADSLDEAIRRRAYEIYEQEGRLDGRDQEHWFRAEAELVGRRTA